MYAIAAYNELFRVQKADLGLAVPHTYLGGD